MRYSITRIILLKKSCVSALLWPSDWIRDNVCDTPSVTGTIGHGNCLPS